MTDVEHVLCVCVYLRDEHHDILAVADWGQRLSFYQLSGKQVHILHVSLFMAGVLQFLTLSEMDKRSIH